MKRKQLTKTMVYESIARRYEELKAILEEVEASLLIAPKENIHYYRKKNGYQFSEISFSDDVRQEKYVSKSEKKKIGILLQKKYDVALKKQITKEMAIIENIIRCNISDNSIDNLYSELPNLIKPYIMPVSMADDDRAEVFQNYKYEHKGFQEGYPEFYTEKGERVRSKSEVAIANELKRQKIPYRYECPLTLKNGNVIYPDFTVLNLKTDKIMYWEHFGMMGDVEYMQNAYRRIEEYKENNIFPGVDLITSEETVRQPLNVLTIRKTIDKYL